MMTPFYIEPQGNGGNDDQSINRQLPPENTELEVLIDDAWEDQSKSGNPMIVMWLQVDSYTYGKWRFKEFLTFSEKSMWKVKSFREAMKEPRQSEVEMIGEDYIGKHGWVKVKHDTYKGQVRLKVGEWLKPEITQAESAKGQRPYKRRKAGSVEAQAQHKATMANLEGGQSEANKRQAQAKAIARAKAKQADEPIEEIDEGEVPF